MYLLDTNVLSELRKVTGGTANPNVVTWQAGVHQSECFISVITLMELELGIQRLARRDTTQAGLLRTWLETCVIAEFADRMLPIDPIVARQCAALHVPDPRSERDALIAATALAHGLTVVTRNTADFEATGVALRNPWLAPA